MLALGRELKRRGHAVKVATLAVYKRRVEDVGLDFHAIRPDWDPTDQAMIARCSDLKTGHEVLIRELVLPYLRGSYDDLLAAATGSGASADRLADFMIAGELVFAAPLVAEKLGLRWVSEILSPESFLSAYDPSLLANMPTLYRLRSAGWRVNRVLLELGRWSLRSWWEPVRQLRRELGLREACEPVFRDKFSPDLVLALFSSCLAAPQPDWPRQTLQPGFVFFENSSAPQQPELAAFLDAGPAPIVFTLGSTAVHDPGNFYQASAAAARLLGKRAILLGAKSADFQNSAEVFVLSYAPYSQVFPAAAAIVHQGGSGTTGQALLAGHPQLIVPYGWDQPDNAARIERLGTGLSLARSQYNEKTAAAALSRLFEDPQFEQRAAIVGLQVRAEDALTAACDAIDAFLETV